MIVWIIAGVVSVVLTAVMTYVFAILSAISLNGFTSGMEAMPYYLIFNCFAWPVMVGIISLPSWIIFKIAKRPTPFKYLILMNAIIVTIALGGIIITIILSEL